MASSKVTPINSQRFASFDVSEQGLTEVQWLARRHTISPHNLAEPSSQMLSHYLEDAQVSGKKGGKT